MTNNLKEKAATGIIWKFLDQGGTQLIQFISGIYIARLLTPEDYGLIGMMAIFIAVSHVFIDSGFQYALLQKGDDVTYDDYNVVFYFNIVISLLFFIIIFLGAPFISQFFDEPKLLMIARILGLNMVLTTLGMIHQTILIKRINFKTITKINLIAISVSVCFGIVFAIIGLGVWSLLVMILVENIMRTTLLWLINKWRPNFSFNIRSFKALFAVSSKLLFAGILTQLSQNVFSTIIGKVFTTNDVGYYSQGRKLQQRIGDFITYSIQNVLVPVQTLLKDDVPRLKNALRTNVKITTLVAFPAIAGLIAIAKPFVILALTIKWLPSIDYIYILSVAGIFFAISIAISSFLLPIGKNNFIVGLTSFSSLALLAFVTIGVWLKVDLKLLVASKVLHEFIILLLVLFASNRFINYRIIEVIKDILPQTIFSSIMGLVVYSIGNIFGVSFFIFALQVISGGILYLLLNYYFNRKMFIEIKTFSKSLMNSQKHN